MKNSNDLSFTGKLQFPDIPVKFTKNFLITLFIFPLIIVFYSCGAGIPSADDQTVKYKPVEMNAYTVSYPIGNGWKSERNRSLNKVTFTRDKSSTSTDIFGVLTGAGSDGSTYISISENIIKVDSTTLKWGGIETAEDFINSELKIMREEGVKKGMFKLRNILKTDTVISGKKFFCMDYDQSEINIGGNHNFYAKNKLALYFPENYMEMRKFYVFHISDISNSMTIGMDTGQLFPVLASFKLKIEVL